MREPGAQIGNSVPDLAKSNGGDLAWHRGRSDMGE
jgi:hypothetical protein